MAIISAFAVILSSILPKYYTAKAVVLPPSNSMSSSLGSLLSGDAALSGMLKSFNILGASTGIEQFLSILESRRMADKVISHFNLKTHFKMNKKQKVYPEDIVKRFHKEFKVSEDDYGNVVISFTDRSPDTAFAIVNYIVKQLDTINYKIAKEHAGHSRHFFDERLKIIRKDMDSAQALFARFKLKHNYLDLNNQLKSTVEVLAGMEAERVTLDLQIAQLRNKMGNDNERVGELMRERSVLSKKVDGYMKDGDGSILLGLKSTPTLGVEYAYLYRDVKVQETIYQFVLQMYEQAKMNEANNVPTVTILEEPTIPQKKVRPKRMIICLLIGFSGFIFVSIFVLLQKWLSEQYRQGTETSRKLAVIASHFRPKK